MKYRYAVILILWSIFASSCSLYNDVKTALQVIDELERQEYGKNENLVSLNEARAVASALYFNSVDECRSLRQDRMNVDLNWVNLFNRGGDCPGEVRESCPENEFVHKDALYSCLLMIQTMGATCRREESDQERDTEDTLKITSIHLHYIGYHICDEAFHSATSSPSLVY